MLCMEIINAYNQNSTNTKFIVFVKLGAFMVFFYYVLKPEGPLWNTLRMRCFAFVTETEQIQ